LESQAGLTLPYKWFATTSTSTQVTVLPWRYDAEMGNTTGYTFRHNTASIMF